MFGVLLVNLTMIDETLFSHQSSPFVYENLFERFFALLLHVFATGKFYSLFAILFGMGAILFMKKFEVERDGHVFFRRRLLTLLILGVCHLIFIWYGDILHVYAIAGFLMLSKRHLDAKRLLTWSLITFLLSTVLFSLLTSGTTVSPEINAVIENSIQMYKQSRYLELVSYRVTWEIPMILINLVIVLPKILSLFFLGAALGKLDVFQNTVKMRGYISKTFKATLVASILFACGYMLFSSGLIGSRMNSLSIVFDELLTVSGSILYASAILVLSRNETFLKRIRPLASVGRMALSNYLAQTVFFTTLLYGYGGGLFHQLPFWSYLPIAFAFFMLQMGFSALWLKKFKQGPVEFLWRKFTYRQTR